MTRSHSGAEPSAHKELRLAVPKVFIIIITNSGTDAQEYRTCHLGSALLLMHRELSNFRETNNQVIGDSPSACVPGECKFGSVPASISEDRHLPLFTKISGERRPISDFDWLDQARWEAASSVSSNQKIIPQRLEFRGWTQPPTPHLSNRNLG
jgi:hypothetical protein